MATVPENSTFDDMQKEFWSDRYREHQTGWDLGIPSPPIADYAKSLTNKSISILIPGCGYGHEVRLLSDLGFTHITALDFVAEALEGLRELPGVNCVQGDFFSHEGQYDLILEQTLFCAIDPSRRDEYVAKVRSLLKPGGKLAGVLFNRDFEGGPPFGGSIDEYFWQFEKQFANVSIKPCMNSAKPRAGTEVFIECY